MSTLHTQNNSSRGSQRRKRVGRGPGSGMGKTSCRGQKGAGARSGYKRRHGKEGGQFPLYRKLPTRGFSNANFKKVFHTINVGQLNTLLEAGSLKEGQTITAESLSKIGLFHGQGAGLKILGEGEITKAVTIEAQAFSSGAHEKLQKAGATCTVVELKKGKVAKASL